MIDDPLHQVQEAFAGFARMAERRAPLYHRLAEGVASDPEAAARMLLAHPDQRQPVLLFAAVHDVLLAGDPDPLRDWYGSVVDHPRHPGRGDEDPWPHFRRLVLEHDGVAERLRTRSTQTNEVGRCATTVLALAGLGRPVGLVEIGASAGLNLRLDTYGYRWSAGERVVGELQPDAPLVLECAVRGDLIPPIPAIRPIVVSRVGVDLHPVDLHDASATRWLVACQWPDQHERVHRARTAIALARGDGPTVVEGDAIDHLPRLVAEVPEHALPVVLSTWVLSYFPLQRRAELFDVLDGLARHRDLSFVFAEQPHMTPGLPYPPRPDGRDDGHATALVRVDWRDGMRHPLRLADQHPHGTWVEWLDSGPIGAQG